ncbi:MAG: hypothetical protein ACR2NN_14385 [Bryobacteraceae bacterium]
METPDVSPRLFPSYAALFIYGAVVAASIWHHEQWADEAHAWLLARDVDLAGLWTRLLHYEGSPGLWHTLLHLAIRLGVPYRGEDVISGLLGFSAAWLVMKRAPFPTIVRLLLPFTYFLCYQYVVVARSYSLLPVLLFACALIYHRSEQRLMLFTVFLSLMAASSAHGFLLSGSIWTASQLRFMRNWKLFGMPLKKRVLIAGTSYLILLVLVAYSAWPAKDVGFPAHVAFSADRILHSSTLLLAGGFSGNVYLTLLLIGLSIPFLYAGGSLPMFLFSLFALVGFAGVVYSQVWHSGTLFLAWLAAMWISGATVKLTRAAFGALIIAITVQCYWTARTISYDWQKPYSGSRAAALYLRSTGIDHHSIRAFGYSCTAIQPYFPRSVFVNYEPGRAYWDWSTRNHVNEPSALFGPAAAEYVMVGYKARPDMEWLLGILQLSGYQQIKHFTGHLFWQMAIFEAEDFDLYRRTNRPSTAALSHLEMADPAAANQLLSGFYPVEGHAWRWSARTFSVALKPPVATPASGARLELHLYVAPDQISKLGALTIHGDVNGYHLKPQTYSSAGAYTYEQDIPANVLGGDLVFGSFAFDKALPPVTSDGRELGAVISSIGLRARQ